MDVAWIAGFFALFALFALLLRLCAAVKEKK